MKEAKAEGWDFAVERKAKNLFPWTWVVPFPGVLGFVQTASVRANGEFIYAPMLWIIREDGTDLVNSLMQRHVFSCSKKLYTTAETKPELAEILGGGGKDWRAMDDELLGYFCKSGNG